MTLTLRIENFDQLDDGGPVSFTLNQRGACVGRNRAMDWVLPDPSRMISGHHFDITYQSGAYYLTDVSMNGTFLQGQSHRLDGAYQIRSGDRFIIGHYIITAQLGNSAHGLSLPPDMSAGYGGHWDNGAVEDDPWSFAAAFDEPVDPHGKPAGRNVFDDVGQSFVPLVRPQNPELPNVVRPSPHIQTGHVPPHMVSPASVQQAPGVPQPALPPDYTPILRAFCEGAGLQLSDTSGMDAEQLAYELGKTVRGVADETIRMLRDRANVKQFTRVGERTMRSVNGNNPLKFMPDVDQALDARFLTPRDGFVTGAEGMETALADIREHQIAVVAALQPALASVLQGLSPEEIEDSNAEDGKIFTPVSKRGRAWDKFVARWDEKAKRGDHGMLDTFLEAFARAYRDALTTKGRG